MEKNNLNKKLFPVFLAFLALLFFAPRSSDAHQPYLVADKSRVKIENPEISKAYYGWLSGSPAVYVIDSANPFRLYVNILVPKIAGSEKDFYVRVSRKGIPFLLLDGQNSDWQEFYEPYGGDYYFKGPEYAENLPEGLYAIEVFNSQNRGKYALAVGEKEEFSLPEILQTIIVLPVLKKSFFEKSCAEIIFSRVGLIYGAILLAVILAAAAIKGFAGRKKGAKKENSPLKA